MKTQVKIHSRVTARVVARVKLAFAAAAPKVTAYALDALRQVGARKLHSLAAAYNASLDSPDAVTLGEMSMEIRPAGALGRALEEGWHAFDMKPKLLAGPNAKQGTKGRYVDVPFRHGIDAGATRLKGVPVRIAREIRENVKAARAFAAQTGRALPDKFPVTGTHRGVDDTLRVRQRRTADGIRKVAVTSVMGAYSQMQRRATSTGSAVFQTFRRVSSNSNGQAWWHPGFAGVHGVRAVARDVARVAKQVLLDELRRVRVRAS